MVTRIVIVSLAAAAALGIASDANSAQAEKWFSIRKLIFKEDSKCRFPYSWFGHKYPPDPRKQRPYTNAEKHHKHGHPTVLSPFADFSNKPNYWGYYVGGGNPHKRNSWLGNGPEPRYVQCEGTWGWDYVPPWSRVRLGWWHGRAFQDGEGQYQADGIVNPLQPTFGP